MDCTVFVIGCYFCSYFCPFLTQLHFTFFTPPFSFMPILDMFILLCFSYSRTDNKNIIRLVQPDVIVMTFWYVFIGTDLTFSKLFKTFILHLGLITTPHVLYVHMTYVYSFFHMFHSSHNHMAKRSHYRIMIFSISEYYSTDASLPSFPSNSSITPPPLYSPSTSINNGPTWRRIPPGREVWSSGRSRLYLGGLSSLQTRHCHGRIGPSIKDVNTAGWTILSGTLTGLGKVQPPIVVRRVVPTRS